MSDNKNFRIILDLGRYFYDHRRVARVFIKHSLKTIHDLQDRISEIFGIQEFYLSTGGHFLPVSEDIRVLHNDETVCVTPEKSSLSSENSEVTSSSSTKQTSIENKQHKRVLDDITEESSQSSSKKKKNKHRINVECWSSTNSEHVRDELEPHKKKKRVKQDSIDDSETPKKMKFVNELIPRNSTNTKDQTLHSNEKSEQKPKHGIVEKEICNLETAHTVLEIKNKLKQKTNEYYQRQSNSTPVKSSEGTSNFKTILPKLQSHIKNCNNFGRSNLPDTVHLSRHIDTPIKTFSKYTPPERITDQYLAKTKINIVKIDVVQGNNVKSHTGTNNDLKGVENIKLDTVRENDEELNTSLRNSMENITPTQNQNPSSPPENYVKALVNSIEKKLSPDRKADKVQNEISEIKENGFESKQNEASNYTKIYLNQSDVSVSTFKDCQTNTSDMCSDSMNTTPIFKGIEDAPRCAQSKKSFVGSNSRENFKNEVSTDVSLDISSIPRDSPTTYETSYDTTLNSTNVSIESNNNPSLRTKRSSVKRELTGVGALVRQLRESDSVLSQESDTSSQYVTQRKRIRKRKRRSKKGEGNKDAEPFVDTKPMKKPFIAKGLPNVHIKFDEHIVDSTEDKIEDFPENIVETFDVKNKMDTDQAKNANDQEISPITEMVILSDENEDPIMENKSIFGNDNILRAPLMENQLEPKVGDIVAFKILKMSDNYIPEISKYIVGKVIVYLLETKNIYFKILSGGEELLPPSGKLTLNLMEAEDTQNLKYKEFAWKEILEPKLLYP